MDKEKVMTYISTDLKIISEHLNKIDSKNVALWGTMSPQRMIEHLTDAVSLSRVNHDFPLELKEEYIPKAQAFLISDHPLPKDFKAAFAPENVPVRNKNITEAVTEFEKAWKHFIADYTANPDKKSLHPNFGILDFDLWKRLHSKHITHHLAQFGIQCQ